jgi:hypothetical protein
MDTLESEIPDLDLSDALSIRPYQFEPLVNDNEGTIASTSSSTDNEENASNRQLDTTWYVTSDYFSLIDFS